MMNLRELYRKFRAWQQEPLHYVNKSTGTERCANCGTTFNDNYCPRCGQKAGTGRTTWESVRKSIMLLWGMDTRSFGNTLVQLVLRPGYLISDYISGRRQVSYPPVKMLAIVTIIVVLAGNILERLGWVASESTEEAEDLGGAEELFSDEFVDWIAANPGWSMLLLGCFLILPTWRVFRYAPRNYHHTVPEGFFIQVYMSTLALILVVVNICECSWLYVLIPIYYVIAYHQVFGYGYWGTLWRWLVVATQAVMALMSFLILWATIFKHRPISSHSTFDELNIVGLFAILYIILDVGCYFINRRKRPSINQ